MIAPGTVIEGRYRVDRLVGEGGFGSVYQGVQLTVDWPIAIKFLRIDAALPADKRADLLSHFVEEARMLSRLRHDCVVRTLDQGIVHDPDLGATPYLVMEWGGEETLRDMLAARGGRPMALEEAWPLFHGIVAGLAHAHTLGIAHRDLKPSNVMLARASDGAVTPRIIDFGIAKLFDRDEAAGSGATRTRSSSTAFTPSYAAPEQIASARTGPWTDVHALGLLFVQMVTGRAPYGDDGSEGLAAIDPNRPTPARFGIDVGPFEVVLAKALSLRPADRYRDASELGAASSEAASSAGLGDTSTASVARIDRSPSVPAPTGGAGGDMTTGAPSSHTLRSDPRPMMTAAEPQAHRSGSRRMLLAAGGITLAAVVGYGVLARSGLLARKHPPPPREPDDERQITSSDPKERPPPGRPTLGSLTTEDLEARAAKAGFSIKFRNLIQNPRQVLLTVEREGALGAVHLVEMLLPHAGLAGAELEATLMPYVGTIVRNYRDTTYPGIAYAFAERTLLLVAWTLDPRVVEWFDALVAGLEISVRGNTITGPDPAAKAAPARAEEPGAKKLSELTPNELRNRLLKPGAEALVATDVASFKFRYGPAGQAPKTAEVRLFTAPPAMPAGAADKHLATLAATKKPHTYARDGAVVVVCEGSTGFDCTAFMKLVLENLPVDLKSLP